MRIAITGATGLIGSALTRRLAAEGHAVTVVTRRGGRAGSVLWDPAAGRIDAAGLEGHDAVIHLAGESVAGLWTRARRARIRESRVHGTALLAGALAGLERPPRALLCASAVGYYGPRPPEEVVDERSAAGEGFLAEVARAWEAAASPAAAAGIRVASMRFGIVLSGEGGALAPMLPPFRLGLGGRMGSGRQIWTWIAIDDLCRAVSHLLAAESLSGPVNFVAPETPTNAEFTRVLARVLRRPALAPVPAFALRLVLGEMAEAMLLTGACVVPRRLLESGFAFRYPDLEGALRKVLGRAA